MEQRYTLALERYNKLPEVFRDFKHRGLQSPFAQLQKKLSEQVLTLFEERLAKAEPELAEFEKWVKALEEEYAEYRRIVTDPAFPRENDSEITKGVFKSKNSYEEKLKKYNLVFDDTTGKLLLYRTQDSKNPVISASSVNDCKAKAIRDRFESYKKHSGEKKRKTSEKFSDKNPTEVQQVSLKKPKEAVSCLECTSTKLLAEDLCKSCLVNKYTSLTENLRSIGETFMQNVTDKEEQNCLKGPGGLWSLFEDDFEAFERLKSLASFNKFLKAFQNLKDIYNKVKPIPVIRLADVIGDESVSQHPKEEDEYEPDGIDDEEDEEEDGESKLDKMAPRGSHFVTRDLLAEFFEVFGDTSFNFQRLRDAYKKSPEVYRVVFEEIKALNCPMFQVVLIDNNSNKQSDPLLRDICTQSLFFTRTDAENKGKSMTADLNGLYRYEIREIPPRVQ